MPPELREYLLADGLFAPRGSTDDNDGSENEDDEDSETEDGKVSFAFPTLDAQIREAISKYDAVFPKLNWSSPKDAQWVLSTSEFMRCTTPAEVYLSLKASDFVQHDLNPAFVFEHLDAPEYELELVLKKWYTFHRSREMRCFVRGSILIAISQRDLVYYDFLTADDAQNTIRNTIYRLWKEEIDPKWGSHTDYIFDVLLTRDLERAHIVDFNPYAPKTDSLMFTYEELQSIHSSSSASGFSPVLRIIDSRSHPLANVNGPLNQHNMLPLDAFSLSQGKTGQEFADALADAIQEANAREE